MSDPDNKDEFDFLPPAEPPPSFTQEVDHYHEQVEAEDFGMVEDFGLQMEFSDEDLLPDNTAPSSLNVGLVGVGGGGNKMVNAFLELGFNKSLLVNTTGKDIPKNVAEEHVVLIPDSDGIGKNTDYGKEVLTQNGAIIEDALRIKLGKVDWLLVFAGGGGGTGSSVTALHPVFERYMRSVQAGGNVVYIVSWPTAQENLNPTIARNALTLLNDVSPHPHVVLDNERSTRLLRGRIGMLGMYPVANTQFAKSFAQILKLSTEDSPIQSFDSKDLETCLGKSGRAFFGSTMIKDPNTGKLGSVILHNCMNRSSCPPPKGKAAAGSLILVASEEMVADPKVSKHLESAIAYVGGRCETLFSGVYVRKNVPGLIAILSMNGLQKGN
jgi:cell division GTPase FtsZ